MIAFFFRSVFSQQRANLITFVAFEIIEFCFRRDDYVKFEMNNN